MADRSNGRPSVCLHVTLFWCVFCPFGDFWGGGGEAWAIIIVGVFS